MTTTGSPPSNAIKDSLSPDRIEMLVVHCSDTPDDSPQTARDIQDMHLGFGWDGVGYHQIIRRDGTRENGRPDYWQGAHAKGVNDRSLSVCLIGRTAFTPAQMHSLAGLLFEWLALYPAARVLGHRDAVETHKTCPNFDAAAWWRSYLAGDGDGPVRAMHRKIAVTAEPRADLPLETEVLFGEEMDILERRQGYARIRLTTDGYVGWVPITATEHSGDMPTHRITATSVFALSQPKMTSSSLMRLDMGAQISILSSADGWHRIALPDAREGYVPAHAACPVDQMQDDYVAVAERFIGAPYLWGGRSAGGLDCSALVQLSLQAVGVDAPRNSGDQLAWVGSRFNELADGPSTAGRGDLVFWPGHVGICQSPDRLLHANAHHHAVATEPLAGALARIDQDTGQHARFFRLTGRPG